MFDPLGLAVARVGDAECSSVEVKKSISAFEVEKSEVALEVLRPLYPDEKRSISFICI